MISANKSFFLLMNFSQMRLPQRNDTVKNCAATRRVTLNNRALRCVDFCEEKLKISWKKGDGMW